MAISIYLLIITLNVNGLSAPIKRHRVVNWIKKQDSSICCLLKTHFRAKDTHRLKVKRWKKIFHANRNDKKAGVGILISDKIEFKTEAITKDKGGHYIMIKGQYKKQILHSLTYVHLI